MREIDLFDTMAEKDFQIDLEALAKRKQTIAQLLPKFTDVLSFLRPGDRSYAAYKAQVDEWQATSK